MAVATRGCEPKGRNEGQTIRLDDEKRVGGGIIKIYLMDDDVHSLCCSPKNVFTSHFS